MISTIVKCNMCGDSKNKDKVGRLVLYEPNLTHGTQRYEVDLCKKCRDKYSVTEAISKVKKG